MIIIQKPSKGLHKFAEEYCKKEGHTHYQVARGFIRVGTLRELMEEGTHAVIHGVGEENISVEWMPHRIHGDRKVAGYNPGKYGWTYFDHDKRLFLRAIDLV